MKLKLFDCNNTLLWERDIDKLTRATILEATQPAHSNISFWAQTLTPIQTNTLKDACISLMSPWVAGMICHRSPSDYRWNTTMISSVIKMGAFDTLTIPARVITWLPRSIYNRHEHPFKTWLRQQDAPHACLHQSRINIQIEGDVRFSRSYKVTEHDNGSFQVHLPHHQTAYSFPVNLTAKHWYYNVSRFECRKITKTITDSPDFSFLTYPEVQQFIDNDIKDRETERTIKGKPPSFKRYGTLLPFLRSERNLYENDSDNSDSSTNSLL